MYANLAFERTEIKDKPFDLGGIRTANVDNNNRVNDI